MKEPFLIRVAEGTWIDPSKITAISTLENVRTLHVKDSGEITWVVMEEEYWPNIQEFIAGEKEESPVDTSRLSTSDWTKIVAIEFRECTECSAKPGTPVLCNSCLENRHSIHFLKEIISRLTKL